MPSTPDASPRSRPARYLDLIRWNRPAGWLLLLWPTLTALWVAAGGFPGWHLLVVFVLGTILMRSAGCCVNDVADRDFDRHVKRTALRPVTSGEVSPREALAVGGALTLAAFGLVLTTNATTVVWSMGALAVTLLYPLAKRHVSMPQAVLGVAFSFGIPMAFTAAQGSESWLLSVVPGGDEWLMAAAQGSVPAEGWLLVLGNLCWVLAYDTEYAMVDRDDDLRIGLKTSAITLGRFDVPAIVLFYLGCLGLWYAALSSARLGWPVLAGLGLALAQVAWHWTLIRGRTRDGCFRAFRANHWLGFAVFAGVALGYALQGPVGPR
jgi:4-hydroxybenzoate polyprenyltransferase